MVSPPALGLDKAMDIRKGWMFLRAQDLHFPDSDVAVQVAGSPWGKES